MFLAQLEAKEKEAFLQIAHHFAHSNNDFSQIQREVIATYCAEMQMDDIAYDDKSFDLSKILAQFSNKRSQKIVLLEIMALAFSERTHFDKEEQEIIDQMLDSFGLSRTLASVYIEWVKAILPLARQGEALIGL